MQTSGVDLVTARISTTGTNRVVELYLFDTSGNDLYQDSLSSYWQDVQYALIVYDIASPESFQHCKQWLELLRGIRCVAGDFGLFILIVM